MRYKRTYKMRKAWGQALLISFLKLGPQILHQNPANFCRISCKDFSVVTHGKHKVLGTAKAARTFHAVNVSGWTRHAGLCWIMKGVPKVLQKWSNSGREV